MTVTSQRPAGAPVAEELLNVTVDGVGMQVPKGTLIIRAAEMIGLAVPRFCDHPLLAPVANCRMCLIEIEGQPKPQPACAVTLAEGMVVKTQYTSEMARQAQTGTMEFLLINHPLDCPVCDKGGECPLQNQAMSSGRGETRFDGPKRTFVKPVNVSPQILLDRERCVSCARCTRFADEIAGDPFIALVERGSQQQVGIGPDRPFDSYFSGNTVQICPVGALTSERYRFRSRPFDLVSTPTVCEHCAGGCALRTDVRRSTVLRRQAGDDPQVNEEWNCDKGRFGFGYLALDRLTTPLVRDEDSGELVPASWPEALSIAARGLAAAGSRTTVLTGGRLTYENAYAYSKFARTVLGTDNVDFRARPSSDEETQFLSAVVAGRPLGPTYTDLEHAPAVVLVGLEPEDEAAIVFLRLRKAVARSGLRVFAVAPFASRGLEKLGGALLPTIPGDEPAVLESLTSGTGDDTTRSAAELLRAPGAVVLVGERMAQVPGALSAAARLADASGARLGWVPRRAGERGALEAGLLPGLLPGGRTLTDASARTELASLWGVDPGVLPTEPGRDLPGMIAAVAADVEALAAATDPSTVQRSVAAVLVAGVEAADLADHDEFLGALGAVPFLVSLEQRPSEISERADVVLPVAVVTEQAGSYVNWEGRRRPFTAVLRDTTELTDARVLALLADEMVPYFGAEVPLHRRAGAQLRGGRSGGGPGFGRGDVTSLAVELAALPSWLGEHAAAPSVAAGTAASPGAGEAVLATWRPLLDDGVLQEGDPFLAATARPAVARVSAPTAAAAGVADGDLLTLATDSGSLTFPLVVTAMPDGVVWVPTRSDGRSVRRTLAVGPGAVVRLSPGGAQ